MAELNEMELNEVSGGVSEPTFNYTIVYGDTLSGIAQRFQTTVAKLQQLNGIANPDVIRAGQVIKVPSSNLKGWI